MPGRDYLSSSRAHSLKVPYSKKEALIKFDALCAALDANWISDRKWNKKQADIVTDLLLLGAYSLPKLVITSPTLDLHIRDVMQKELIKCFEEIRKGKQISALNYLQSARHFQDLISMSHVEASFPSWLIISEWPQIIYPTVSLIK